MSIYKVGDIVGEYCYNGFASGGHTTIKDVKTVYSEETGEPIEIVSTGGNSWYYAESGDSYKQKMMYHITKPLDN